MRSQLEKNKRATAELGLGCLVAVVGIPITFLLNAFTLKTIWNWFVPPVTGWTSISIWGAMGLSLVAGSFTRHLYANRESKDKDGSVLSRVLSIFLLEWLSCGLLLLMGWGIHHFMAS